MVKIPSNLVEAIEQNDKFFLFAHSRPDGDALGSLFGLADILQAQGKKVWCFVEAELPLTYAFLPAADNLIIGSAAAEALLVREGTDCLAIALDCGDVYRLGIFQDIFAKCQYSLVMDHHKSHLPFGDISWVEAALSSTGEMVFELAAKLDMPLSYEAALCLYVAIVSDTGGFRYSSTSARTHVIAGELLALGVLPDQVGSHLYDNWTLSRLQLMQMVLGTLEMNCEGQVASVYVTDEMFAQTGASKEDTGGFVDYPRSIASVKVAIFLKGSEDGSVSVSLRAKGGCDVSLVAEQFGGGGHYNAAGFRLKEINLLQARSRVVTALRAALS
ncbi:DHH family phosphoesterase [Desulfotalea psychrophila]|uniref:Uncharacterized protein n=1 Tax=Desulfotalea psychrophila (strain LSv54 / DSM 12343) TaxID=177439 RepID=Q6AJY6_DESPS|nr:bifunctional oligoribonuclease/PAP phosphatase NrnA [Desulfotalea psychrophila]CAG37340.1 conserved hypothetical protein [Desulfotalea psychrophila LSv54]